MAFAWRRKTKDGLPGRWVACWEDENGKRRSRTCSTSKRDALAIANAREEKCVQLREGLTTPREESSSKASRRSMENHIEDYRLNLLSRGDTAAHAGHVAGVIARVLADASIQSLSQLAAIDRIQDALGRLKVRRSARTVNHARGAILAFVRWLDDTSRITEAPSGIRKLARHNEAADRRLVRSPLSETELTRLLASTVDAEPLGTRWPKYSNRHSTPTAVMTGIDRVILYLLAASTGFRFSELGSLTPESFMLDGPKPTVTCRAGYTKNGKPAIQPISRVVADRVASWLSAKPPNEPVFPLPSKGADMLRADLKRAGIEPTRANGEKIDFHALRHTFITNLVMANVNIKIVQTLARHSTITLTMDRYAKVEAEDVRSAIDPQPQTEK